MVIFEEYQCLTYLLHGTLLISRGSKTVPRSMLFVDPSILPRRDPTDILTSSIPISWTRECLLLPLSMGELGSSSSTAVTLLIKKIGLPWLRWLHLLGTLFKLFGRDRQCLSLLTTQRDECLSAKRIHSSKVHHHPIQWLYSEITDGHRRWFGKPPVQWTS